MLGGCSFSCSVLLVRCIHSLSADRHALTVHSTERSRFTSDSRVSLEKLAVDREVFAFATVNAEPAKGA
jgi:hypothetical protein